jgi:hypothetical protein
VNYYLNSLGLNDLSGSSFIEALIYIRLSKPPLIPDLIKFIVEGVVPTRLVDTEEFKFELARLTVVKDVKELDSTLSELLTNDLNEVYYYLPNTYVNYLNTLLESSELGLLYATLTSKDTSNRNLKFIKLQDYEVCRGRGFSCIVSKHLSRLKDVCEDVGEDYEPAIAIATLYDILQYVRYLDNLEVLGLRRDVEVGDLVVEGVKFFRGVGALYFEVGLEQILRTSKKFRVGTLERFIEEVSTLYQLSKDVLYYRGGVLNLLTLYGIDRLLRYELLRVLFSRWLRPW